MESVVLSVVENDMTLCRNEREVLFTFGVHLFGLMRRHSVLYSLNSNDFQSSMSLSVKCMFQWMSQRYEHDGEV